MTTVETMAWVYIGVVAYAVAYLVVGCGLTGLWKMWATHKVGIFWDYSINEGLKLYYPEIWYFVYGYPKIYSVTYVILWPIMVPLQLVLMTRVLNRLASGRYYY